MLVVPDIDILDDAGNVGRNTDLVSLDIGIVGRHHPAAGAVPVSPGTRRDRQQRKQRPADPLLARRPGTLVTCDRAFVGSPCRADRCDRGRLTRLGAQVRSFVSNGRLVLPKDIRPQLSRLIVGTLNLLSLKHDYAPDYQASCSTASGRPFAGTEHAAAAKVF